MTDIDRTLSPSAPEATTVPDTPPTVPPTHEEFHGLDAAKETLEA